jgi:hypothetical protein
MEVVDYATGVKGSYCIGKFEGFWSFWNPNCWAGSGYVFTDKKLANAVCKLLKEGSEWKMKPLGHA